MAWCEAGRSVYHLFCRAGGYRVSHIHSSWRYNQRQGEQAHHRSAALTLHDKHFKTWRSLTMIRQRTGLFFGILALLFAATYAHAKKQPWQAELEKSLAATYEISKISIDATRVTKPGVMLVIRKDGVSADIAGALTLWKNKVVDGKVQQGSGTAYVFKPGEKVYVRALFVTDTEVQFMLVSAEMYDLNVRGTTQRTRYQSNVNFEFPQGTLETADAAAVKKVIDEVLATEETVNAVKTSTVELGQTPEQVEAAMGKPETIVKLGAKMTYVYKTMKIIFQDGKVADVQ
jgi:hypothetical protein